MSRLPPGYGTSRCIHYPPPPPQAMGLAGVYITEEDVTALVEEVDDSGDGLIDFNEFRNTVLGF